MAAILRGHEASRFIRGRSQLKVARPPGVRADVWPLIQHSRSLGGDRSRPTPPRPTVTGLAPLVKAQSISPFGSLLIVLWRRF
jgi:hypothetical protein